MADVVGANQCTADGLFTEKHFQSTARASAELTAKGKPRTEDFF